MEWIPVVCGALLLAVAAFMRWQDVRSINAIKALWDEDRTELKARIRDEWQRARAEVEVTQQRLEAARESQANTLIESQRTLAAMKIARSGGTPTAPRARQNGTPLQRMQTTTLPQDGLD